MRHEVPGDEIKAFLLENGFVPLNTSDECHIIMVRAADSEELHSWINISKHWSYDPEMVEELIQKADLPKPKFLEWLRDKKAEPCTSPHLP